MALHSNFQIADMPARYLAYIRHTGPYAGNSALFGKLFNSVFHWISEKGLATQDMEAITVYHDDPEHVPEVSQRISVGFTVPAGTTGDDTVHIMEIPPGKYAIGSFELLPHEYAAAWEEAMLYIHNIGLFPSGDMMYESYRNEPGSHPEGKHLTDICIKL